MKNLRKLNIIITSILLIFTCFSFRVNVSAEETNDKAAFDESVTLDDVTVTVSAPEGVFPEGSHLQVNKVTDNNVDEAVSEIRDQYTNVVETISFDIKVLDKDGNEVQPDDTVKVSFAYKTNTNDNLDTNVYHIDNELNVEQLDVEVVDDTATVETDSFSIYTVEFTYDNKQYVMEGNTSVKLSDILDYVGLAGNVENVVVSNTELVSAEEVDGEWIITSLQPFTSDEWMKVTLDGVEYEIVLTDEVTDSGNFGTNLYWEINGDTLTIRPADGHESGTLPNGNQGASNPPSEAILNSIWPWQGSQSKADITKIVIENGVVARAELRYMFYGLTNLESADLSGLNGGEVFNDLFRNCTNLKEVDLNSKNFSPKQMNRIFMGCSKLERVAFGSLDNPVDLSRLSQTNNMFNGCSAMKTVEIPGVTVDYDVNYFLTNIQSQIKSANGSGIKILKMPGITLPNASYRRMFHISSLEELYFNGSTFLEKYPRALFHDFDDSINVKSDADPVLPNLKVLDMSGVAFTSEEGSAKDMLIKMPKLEKAIFDNISFPDSWGNYQNFLKDCTNLKEASFNGNVKVKGAINMNKMFENCTLLETLDVSGFGELPEIVNMDDFVAGDIALKTLIIDNLDNSHIAHTNDKHSAYSDDAQQTGGKEFGREIFGLGVYDVKSVFTSLETISAENSKIWLCKNISGNPGNEYYNVSEGSEILYLAKGKQIKLNDITLETQRDYIDVITDRDNNENKHTITPNIELPDKDKNINIVNNLNTNGPGFLAPGVYTFTDDDWKELEHAPMDDTYYRISYIGNRPYEVRIDGEKVDDGKLEIDGLVIVQGDNNTYINTTRKQWPESGNVTIDKTIEIIYKDAAIDVNGKYHDVIMTINSITFKNLERIPKDPNREHDDNKYYDTDGGGTYYRTILQASGSQGVIFRNYVMISEPTNPWPNYDVKAISGGSGTDIDFNIKIGKANDDTSFVFYVDDLDVAEYQNWVRPNPDACYDNLPVGNVVYGTGGEGFIIKEGNDEPKFAEHTGLAYVDNQVITTGSDPNTPWSEFTVTANAKEGGNYIWTSGVGCTTYVLKNTSKLSLGEIKLDLQATKKLLGDTLQADQFEFELKPDDNVSDNKATGTVTVKNGADGIIKLLEKTFDPDNKVNIGGVDYYPGTDPDGNTSGGGVHNKYVYAYIVKEISGNETDIKYDENPHNLRIEVSTPENDAEMAKGIKAEIFVDGNPVKTVWSKDTDKTVNKITFTNKKVLKLTVSNELIGPDADPDKEFTFTVTADDETTKTFKLKGGETSEVIELVAGTNYTIVQDDCSEDGYLTKVGDEKKLVVTGTISAQTDVKFTNIKKPFIDPPVKKTVSGDKPDSDGLFTFEIIGLDNAPMPAGSKGNSKKVTITGADEFEFGNIYFEDPGVYTYTIREINNGVNGYTYDDSVYQIVVEIDDDYNAVKTVTKNGEPYMSDDEVVVFAFDNVYKKDSKPQRKAYVIPKTGID